jgi:hypothetical protein
VNYIGIDPGASGGIAILSHVGGKEWSTFACRMPETDRDIADVLHAATPIEGETLAVIEKVNPGVFGRPGARMGVVSAFTFGGSYRALKMALTCSRIPYDEVLPVKWQTALGCRSRGDKNVTKARAQQLFPFLKVTHAIADALLIAEFCRRLHSGATLPVNPAQQELFDGKEKRTEGQSEELHIVVANEEDIDEIAQRILNSEGAAHATAVVAAGNGRPRHRRHRERSSRLR